MAHRLIAVTVLTVLSIGACATQGAHVSKEDTQANYIQSVSDLLNAQLKAVTGRLSAPARTSRSTASLVDPASTKSRPMPRRKRSPRVASKNSTQGFKPSKPLTLIGEDTDTVRWAGLRFGSKGQLWTVTTLLTGPAPWQIVAQSGIDQKTTS